MLNFLKSASVVEPTNKKTTVNADNVAKEKALKRLSDFCADPTRLMSKGITKRLEHFVEVPTDGEKRQKLAGVISCLGEVSKLVPDGGKLAVLIARTNTNKGSEKPKFDEPFEKAYLNKHTFIIATEQGYAVLMADVKTGAIYALTSEQQLRAMPV